MKKISSKSMDKRGLIIEVGAILIIAITTLGVLLIATNESPLFVGNTESKIYLNYFKCKDQAQTREDSNLVVFSSKEEAISKGYEPLEGCV